MPSSAQRSVLWPTRRPSHLVRTCQAPGLLRRSPGTPMLTPTPVHPAKETTIMRSRSHAVYVISVAAELAGMHPQTLRIYERRGLVQPARSQGGNRRYSDIDIDRLRRIQELAGEGMNLEGIRRVMALESEVERLRAENANLRELVNSALAEAERRAPRRDLVPLHQAVAL